jgi:branched-chain amino acid transport system substrate-binding protein
VRRDKPRPMMSIIRPRAVLAALTAAIALTGGTARAADPPITVNVIGPLTGSAAFLGKSYSETFRALEIALNRTGGVNGRHVTFAITDSQTSPQTGLQLVNGLIADKVAVFIDGGPSTVCSSSIPLVANTGPVDYCLSPVIRPATGSYVFSSGFAGADQARTSVRYFRERGWTHIAMLSSTDTTGSELEKGTDAALALPENKTMQLVERDHFNGADLSVAAQVARIKASGAQAVIVWTTGSPFGTALHSLKDGGIALPVLTTNSNMTYAQMNSYAAFMPVELYFPALLAMTPDATLKGPLHDAQVAYVRAFSAIGVKPDEGNILAWDPAMIIVSALRSIGPNATAQQIRDYILHLHGWVGVDGVYDFSSGNQRGIGENAAAVARWDASAGKWIRVSRPGGYLK